MRYLIILISLLVIFSCSETPNEVPVDSYREVTFHVNMNNYIEGELFEIEKSTLGKTCEVPECTEIYAVFIIVSQPAELQAIKLTSYMPAEL